MRKHIERCTMNPNRHCGMCDLLELEQRPIGDLLAILAKHKLYRMDEVMLAESPTGIEDIDKHEKAAIEELGDEVEHCPACMLAAIRQAGVSLPWRYKEAMKETMDCHNDSMADMGYE